ncbi:NADH dehydrogenase [Collibacillus ludicampi]|uniref:NADH dehydrogenase n=1 Tax=Collibacillus ludicampi TaxID=2771369 RepID=A0AAV4LI03_9BACL|nr:NAD(P)/FAD-dependent oxidoreductase [Collibacillus ludicampi]GIM47343.1 NADH dehydrogenase [Collibacillus ludicampi]
MTKIVVLGAGYAGIACGVRLQKLDIPFTLINKHRYHYFTTLLHELAGGRNDAEEYYVDLEDVLNEDQATIIQDVVTALRPQENKIITEKSEYEYDYLVFALGNAPEFFGIPGLKEHALLLRSLDTAKEIREHVEEQFLLYNQDQDSTRLRIIVGGAGLTGIELVGELAEWLPQLTAAYRVPSHQVEVINIEAAPVILPMLDKSLQETAMNVLTKKGIKIRTGEKITRVGEHVVELASGETIEAKTIIWTGGVRANPLLAEAGFETDPRGRAKVNEYLQSVDYENVFVLGDSSCFIGPDGKPLPPTGQLASQMGEHCAKNLNALLRHQELRPFEFHYMGTLASLGSEVGVGNIKGFKTSGVPAGFLKEMTKVKYLYNLGGLRMVAKKRGQFMHR